MTLDHSYFEEMEARIPHGKVRTAFAPSPTYRSTRTPARPSISSATPTESDDESLRLWPWWWL